MSKNFLHPIIKTFSFTKPKLRPKSRLLSAYSLHAPSTFAAESETDGRIDLSTCFTLFTTVIVRDYKTSS